MGTELKVYLRELAPLKHDRIGQIAKIPDHFDDAHRQDKIYHHQSDGQTDVVLRFRYSANPVVEIEADQDTGNTDHAQTSVSRRDEVKKLTFLLPEFGRTDGEDKGANHVIAHVIEYLLDGAPIQGAV
jgi:hypothetical protein